MLTNGQKTTLLLLSLAGLSAAAGYVIGGAAGVVLAAVLTVAYVLVRASLPAHFVMRLNRARPLDPWTAPALYRMANQLAQRAGVTTPQLYLIRASESNAMSTGGPANGAVAVTTGLLRLLSPQEVEGVLAHEIAHIRHDDVRLLDVASGAASAIVLLLEVALWVTVLFTLLFGSSLGGSLWRVVQLAALAFTVPWLVGWLQSALSRTRELAADATAARISGRARELASALLKLKRQRRYLLGMLTGRAEEPPMLRSHPATEERVRRLLTMAPPPQPQRIPPALRLRAHPLFNSYSRSRLHTWRGYGLR